MTIQHTPGPWKTLADPVHAGKHPYHEIRFVATDDAQWENGFDSLEAGNLICSMRDAENMQANARLIAAAPELFEALKACEEALSEVPCLGNKQESARIQARAAIAKTLLYIRTC